MKEIKVVIPDDKLNVVVETEVLMNLNPAISVFNGIATVHATLANNQTAAVIEELKGIGVGQVFGTISLLPVDIEISSITRRIKKENMQRTPRHKGKGISLDEMIANVSGLGVITPTFCILSIVASFLAAFGLINDSVVIVIASMIIAPLLGPIALTVIGTLLPDNRYRVRAPLAEITGLSICVLVGMFIGFLFPFENVEAMPWQVISRTYPGIGDIAFAIGSGLAAGIFIVRGESTNLVGVAVAASLCPPATNVGILIASGALHLAFGSFMLLILNVISIYAACAIIFWISQTIVRGGTVSSRQFQKISKRYLVQLVVMIVILVLIIVLILQYIPVLLG